MPIRTRKQLGLLYYLARRAGRPSGRDELIDLLWGSDAERAARHSLSQSVSLVNKVVGHDVITSSGRDRVLVERGLVWLDVDEFERAVAEGRNDEALALWRGPVFEDTWVHRAAQFERWMHEERDRLQRVFRRVAQGRLELLRAEGNHAALRDESERLLQVDPLDEKAMLAHLESLTLLDDRVLALRRYGQFERRLREELDAEPGSSLRTWVRRHRKGDGEAARPAVLPRVSEWTVLPTPQPLYGRTEEFAVLWEGWEQAKIGRGSFIIVEGEAGIGKTALATKLVNQAHVAGGSVCFVRCYRTEKSVPFAPVTSLIRQLSRLPGFVGLDPVWIGELTRLVPELRERYPHSPIPMAVDDAARHRLSDGTVQAALAVADELPLMIVIDDLQDADEASLAVIHYLSRHLSGQTLVGIGIRRPDPSATDVEKAFVQAVRKEAHNRFVAIRALPLGEIVKLVQHLLASTEQATDETVINRLAAEADGNPLFAIDATLSLKSETRKEPSAPKAPAASVRLQELSRKAIGVASSIAIVGRPVSHYELGSITELQIAELGKALAELDSLQIIRRVGERIALSHEGYTDSIQSNLESVARKALQSRVAAVLLESAAGDPATYCHAARLLLEAGEREQARLQAEKAARFALSLGATRERAFALSLVLESSPSFSPAVAAELGSSLLELREFDRITSLCAAADSLELSAVERASFSYLLIALDYFAARVPHTELVERLVGLVSDNPAFPFSTAARTLLMRLAGRSGNRALARKTSRDLRHVLRNTPKASRGHELLAVAYVAAKYNSPRRALPLLRQALERALRNHDLDLEHLCRSGLGAVLRQLGQYRLAVEEAELALALSSRALSPHLQALDEADIAAAEMARGNYNRAQELYESAALALAKHGDAASEAHVRANLGELFLIVGNVVRAKTCFEQALQNATRLHVLSAVVHSLAGLALCAHRRGQIDDMHRLCRDLTQYGDGRERVFHDRWMTEAALAWSQAHTNGASAALQYLEAALADLRRRDTDQYLALWTEKVIIELTLEGEVSRVELDAISAAAQEVDAAGVLLRLGSLAGTKP